MKDSLLSNNFLAAYSPADFSDLDKKIAECIVNQWCSIIIGKGKLDLTRELLARGREGCLVNYCGQKKI